MSKQSMLLISIAAMSMAMMAMDDGGQGGTITGESQSESDDDDQNQVEIMLGDDGIYVDSAGGTYVLVDEFTPDADDAAEQNDSNPGGTSEG